MSKEAKKCSCSTCKQSGLQPLENFGKDKNQKDGLRTYCKACISHIARNPSNSRKEYIRNWEKNNKNKRKSQRDQYYLNNREDILYRQHKRYETLKDDEDFKKSRREYERNKYKTDIAFRLSSIISVGIRETLKGTKNCQSWQSLVGYSVEELKIHLEKVS